MCLADNSDFPHLFYCDKRAHSLPFSEVGLFLPVPPALPKGGGLGVIAECQVSQQTVTETIEELELFPSSTPCPIILQQRASSNL